MSGHALVAWLAALAWLGLLACRGRFWQVERHIPCPEPAAWPEVVAVIPARDEAAVIGETVRSLLGQDYPGRFSVVVVDDGSRDGTAEAARVAAAACGAGGRLTVLPGGPLPPGWAGKVWAQSQGVAEAARRHPGAELLLLSDADIDHAPDQLRLMVARLIHHDLDLASLMVRLSTESFAEQAMVPAFVFFFRLLYPFHWVKDPARATAAAAGGYMLIRRRTLAEIGGIGAIKDALIDDCALAAAVKARKGRIWLGLSARTVSRRVYEGWGGLWMMIARSAYTQLDHSPLLLAGTVAALVVGFLVPPVFTLAGGDAVLPAMLAWTAMVAAYVPMLRFYNLSLVWGPLLPLVVLVYMGATIDSARRHWLGRGGEWKGRVQAPRQTGKEA